MIKIKEPKDCCGCTACANICAHDAIAMKPDSLGFLYPEVDTSKCVECGLCEKVCAFNDDYDISSNFQTPKAFGARHKNMDEVQKSRSGATFVAVSDYVLSKGGVIYGVGYNDHFRVAHKRATNTVERDEFRGSKYVQSDLSDIFTLVKKDLKDGRIVLFVGTGCQVAGLKSFIGYKLRGNLILMDIICHGVMPPYYWRDYIDYLEKSQGSKLTAVNFRDKEKYGWDAHHESFVFEDGQKLYPSKCFYNNVAFRDCCSSCHFCNTKRPSDMTIGDFWGWQKQNPDANSDDKGLSLVLVNTEKGTELWDLIKDKLDFFSADPENYLQPNLQHPTNEHDRKKQFVNDFIIKGFEHTFSKDYNRPRFVVRVLLKIRSLIKRVITV